MSEKKINLYAYCRISTKLQELENQRIAINNFVKIHEDKYEIIDWFEEEKSAFKERPAFNRMMEMLYKNNDINGIIVQRIDRIGRSVKQLSNIMDELEKNGKIFIATEQNINPYTIEGKLLRNILSSIAEFEVDLFKERSKEGRERYIANKGKWGRNRKEIPEKTLKNILQKHEDGLGMIKLCRLLSLEGIKISPSTLWRRIHNK